MFIIIISLILLFLFFNFFSKKDFFLNTSQKTFDQKTNYNIYIITTKKNKDHSISFVNSIKKEDDDVFIIEAILNKDKAIGCKKSHKYVLELIKKNNNGKLNLIFEDDVGIIKNSRKIIDEFLEKDFDNKNFDQDFENKILFLGYCFEQFPEKTNEKIQKYPIIKLHSPRCTHSYVISNNTAEKLLDILNNPLSIKNAKINDPIDELIGRAIFNGVLTSYGIDLYKQPWQ